MKARDISVSTVYTSAMPKTSYVQVVGVEKVLRIEADKTEKDGIGTEAILRLKKDDQQVGEFKFPAVQGWWIHDE